MNFFLESELLERTAEIDRDIAELQTKLVEPSHNDVIFLIRVHEDLRIHNHALKHVLENIPESESFLKEQETKMEKLVGMATALITAYLPLAEAALVKDAKKHIECNNEREFRRVVWDIEALDSGTGKVSHDNGWISWDKRPWHVYDVAEELKKQFVSANGSLDRLAQWEMVDEWTMKMR